MRLLTLALALALSSGLTACAESPERAFEKFYEALAAGDDEALARLSAQARARLDDDARKALLATPPQASIKTVRLVERTAGDAGDEDGARARLEVIDALGDVSEVRLVREGGAWRVDL